jgi:nifR3 family TIM-barrel protein
VSESPFRRLCRRYGADVVVSEFVSAAGIVMRSRRSRDYLRFDEAERPIGIQIFGADPGQMAEAAAFVAQAFGPDFIDINFGCPAKKVVKRNGGSGCLRDLDLVERIIRAVDDATSLPTTVKIRSGYDAETRDPVGIALRCQEAGARALCLHPRTRADMYGGEARWSEIGAVVEALEIPVIGNGDIRTGLDARRMKDETGCAAVMIARGSHGDPWIFTQARAALDGAPIPPEPDVEERFRICLEHARNAIAFEQNAERAILDFRKHLGWYTRGVPEGRRLRTELFQATTLQHVEELLEGHLEAHGAGQPA